MSNLDQPAPEPHNLYQFSLKYRVADTSTKDDHIMHSLADQGCTDAMVGLGTSGYIDLNFSREAESAEIAILSALADVARALPNAILVEAGPDYVGLTDVAETVGYSRQYMRKLMIANPADFPAPTHSGASGVWHLFHVLQFLQSQTDRIAPQLLEVAFFAMQVNVFKELLLLHKRSSSLLKPLLKAY